MTAAELMQIEAIRTAAIAAMKSCQGVAQSCDAILLRPVADQDDEGSTFDDSPTNGVDPNGTNTKIRRRR